MGLIFSALVLLACPAVSSARSTVWKGGANANAWDLNSSTNWLVSGTSTPAVPFLQGDNVTFDDTGSTSPAVNVIGLLSPGNIQVSNTGTYTFSGTGTLGGTGALVKSGAGTLTLSPTVVSVSAVTTSNSAVVGVSSATGLVIGMGAGGTGLAAGATITAISGTNVTLSQAATATGSAVALTFFGDHTYSGGTTIGGGILALSGYQQTALGGGIITLQGGGTLAMNGVGSSSDYGTLTNAINLPASQTGSIRIMQRGNFSGAVTGPAGSTLNVQVNYIRGAILGDWSAFAGQINVTAGVLAGQSFKCCDSF